MSNSIQTTPARPVDVLNATLGASSVQTQFRNALGEHKDAFIASLVDLFTGDKALQTCKPKLIVAEALRAATLRLPLNKALGFAYIVVYNNTVRNPDGSWTKVPTPTFIPGYKGYIQLAMRTGQYRTINADVVYEGELRRGNKLSGEILLDGERKSDKVVGYFCYFELLNGFSKTLYMSVEDMARYAKRYAPGIPKNVTVEQLVAKANEQAASKQVGWMGNFGDMAIKTVVRRLISKYGYLSVEMQNAMSSDINAESAAGTTDQFADVSKKVIDIESSQYEEISVDKSTGEVEADTDTQQTSQPEGDGQQTEIEPGY